MDKQEQIMEIAGILRQFTDGTINTENMNLDEQLEFKANFIYNRLKLSRLLQLDKEEPEWAGARHHYELDYSRTPKAELLTEKVEIGFGVDCHIQLKPAVSTVETKAVGFCPSCGQRYIIGKSSPTA